MVRLVVFQTTDGTILSAYVYKDNMEAVCYMVAKKKGKELKKPFAPISVVELNKQPKVSRPKAAKKSETTTTSDWEQIRFKF